MSQLYDKGREKFLNGDISWGTGVGGDIIKCLLVTAGYTPVFATDEFIDDGAGGGPWNYKSGLASDPLAGKTITAGVADADDAFFAGVTGSAVIAVVIFLDTGNPLTSPLIAYIDSGTGFPYTPSGADVNVVWDNGVNRIFSL